MFLSIIFQTTVSRVSLSDVQFVDACVDVPNQSAMSVLITFWTYMLCKSHGIKDVTLENGVLLKR